MNVQMRIASLLIDPGSGMPIVVLMEIGGQRAVPIVIGMAEAEAIALALQDAPIPRPRTHDLMCDLLVALDARLEGVVVSDLRESTFFATLYVRTNDTLVEIDSRPSDAIALACRTDAPIYVDEEVLERARMTPPDEAKEGRGAVETDAHEIAAEDTDTEEPAAAPLLIDPEADQEALADILENLEPGDFGKYEM